MNRAFHKWSAILKVVSWSDLVTSRVISSMQNLWSSGHHIKTGVGGGGGGVGGGDVVELPKCLVF